MEELEDTIEVLTLLKEMLDLDDRGALIQQNGLDEHLYSTLNDRTVSKELFTLWNVHSQGKRIEKVINKLRATKCLQGD